MQFVRRDRARCKAITIESKVFSIYATGYVKSGKRETRVRVHAVVDFRGAPAIGGAGVSPPGTPPPTPPSGTQAPPPGGAPQGIQAALEPNAGGNVIYFRVE